MNLPPVQKDIFFFPLHQRFLTLEMQLHSLLLFLFNFAIALSVISYDQYKNHDMVDFLVDDVTAFDEYLKVHPMVRMVPCSNGSKDDVNISVPGETPNVGAYPLASEECKVLGHSLFDAIWERAKNDQCFGPFNESNIFVSSLGKAKFHYVLVLPKSDTLLRQSLLSARGILLKIVTKDKKPIPDDIQHLLDIVLDKTIDYFELFHIHPSMAPISNGFAILIKLYEELKNLPETQQKQIYRSLPYIDNWKRKVPLNNLLKKPFNFFPGRYDDPLRQLRPQELAEKRGEQFSDYMRNSTAHRRDPPELLVNQQQGQVTQQPGPPLQQKRAQAKQMWVPIPQKLAFKQTVPVSQQQQLQGPSSQPQGGGIQPSKLSNQQAVPDRFELVRTIHYPRFMAELQEQIYKIHPKHIRRLNLHMLF